MRVALVYDRVNKWGGAERVLLALRELFPEAPIYTSVYNKTNTPWAKDFTIIPSFLQKTLLISNKHELIPYLMPIAFETFSFDAYDVVISVTSEAAKGIITSPKTLHICYCLTPTRYLWSGYEEYFANPIFRFLTQPIVSYLRMWDTIAAARPDAFIAISYEVQERIKKYYGKESEVIYPPVAIQNIRNTKTTMQKTGYFLVVSRLVPYKRIDIAIEACNQLKLPLVVIGTGGEENRLKRLAGPTVTFQKNLTDAELVEYYKGCKALLFPGYEDFGLVMVEAQQVGRPVIAFNAGGAKEIVSPGKTGELFQQQQADALIDVLKKFDEQKYREEDCIQQGKKFNKEKFKKAIVQSIIELQKRTI